MGLDLAELALDVEDAFEVSIPEEAWRSIDTPGKLIDWLDQELASRSTETKPPEICITQRAFFVLRKKLLQHFDLAKKEIRPSTPLEKLIPLQNLIASWRQLQESLKAIHWPLLARPVWIKTILGVTTLSFLCWTYFKLQTVLSYPPSGALMMGTILSFFFLIFGLYCTRSWIQYFPWKYQQLRDLVRFLVAKNMFLFAPYSWTRNQIKNVIQEILREAFNITQFQEDDHFIKDLGLD